MPLWPLPCFWLTMSGGGVSPEVSGFPERWRLVAQDLLCPGFGRKLSFYLKLWHRAYRVKILRREEDRLGDFSRSKNHQNKLFL
jgi:hypothetical protein